MAGINMSPAYMLYGRQLRDALPSIPRGVSYVERYGQPSQVWTDIRRARELSHSQKQASVIERYNRDKHLLTPLMVGDSVSIQNQRGSHPLRWDRTGIVVERLQHKQYLIRVDGSGNVVRRNRAHLRKIDPATRDGKLDYSQQPTGEESQLSNDPVFVPGSLQDGTQLIPPMDDTVQPPAVVQPPVVQPPVVQPSAVQPPALQSSAVQPPAVQPSSAQPPAARPAEIESSVVPSRRSTRVRGGKTILSPTMHGKHHEDVQLS